MSVMPEKPEVQNKDLWFGYETMSQTAEILKEERVLMINRIKYLENKLSGYEPNLLKSDFENELNSFEDYRKRFPTENESCLQSAYEELLFRKKVFKAIKKEDNQ